MNSTIIRSRCVICSLIKCHYNKIKYFFEKARGVKSVIIILSIIFLFSLSSIIRSNFYYIDDLARAAHGYQGWENFSRYTSNLLSSVVHASSFLMEVSPLTQIIAAMIMITSCILMIRVIIDSSNISILQIICSLPLAFSPYFLECFSYKFDSPYMALSVLACIFPFLFCKNKIIFFLLIVLCILITCTTYQASLGIFMMLVVVKSFILIENKNQVKDILCFVVVSCAGFLIALLIFKFFIMVPADSYVSNKISMGDVFYTYKNNITKYYSIVMSDLHKKFENIFMLICVLYVLVAVVSAKINKILAGGLALVSLGVMFLCAFGLYPILSKPLFAPRAMYGVGALIAIISIYISSKPCLFMLKTINIYFSYIMIVVAFAYGNALYLQNEYANFRADVIAKDISEMNGVIDNKNIKELTIVGSIGHAPNIKKTIQKWPILRRLVPVLLTQDWYWGSYRLVNWYGLKNLRIRYKNTRESLDFPVIKKTSFHTIMADEKNIIIYLNR